MSKRDERRDIEMHTEPLGTHTGFLRRARPERSNDPFSSGLETAHNMGLAKEGKAPRKHFLFRVFGAPHGQRGYKQSSDERN